MVGRNHRALLEEGKIIYDNQIFVFILFFLAERKMRSAIDKEREANDLQRLVSFSFLICNLSVIKVSGGLQQVLL